MKLKWSKDFNEFEEFNLFPSHLIFEAACQVLHLPCKQFKRESGKLIYEVEEELLVLDHLNLSILGEINLLNSGKITVLFALWKFFHVPKSEQKVTLKKIKTKYTWEAIPPAFEIVPGNEFEDFTSFEKLFFIKNKKFKEDLVLFQEQLGHQFIQDKIIKHLIQNQLYLEGEKVKSSQIQLLFDIHRRLNFKNFIAKYA